MERLFQHTNRDIHDPTKDHVQLFFQLCFVICPPARIDFFLDEKQENSLLRPNHAP